MNAWVLHDIGDIRWETMDQPEPGSKEVLVAVKAVGICGSDIPRIYQTGAHHMPLVPGHEFSGVVKAVGADVPSSWRGRRVGVFPLLPCKACAPCREKRYEMCRHYDYLGSRCNGAFAEYVSVPAWNLIELPETVTYEEAAMLEPMAVAVHAMRQAVRPGAGGACTSQGSITDAYGKTGVSVQTGAFVVCGLGTIGQLLLMFLLEAKRRKTGTAAAAPTGFCPPMKILAIGNKESQRQNALRMGLPADCYHDSGSEDMDRWLREQTDGAGADVFFECVGKNETISQAVAHTAFGGRVILIGNPYTDLRLEKAVYWKILRNQLTVQGTWNSSFTREAGDDWHYVLERLSGGQIAPTGLISHRLSLNELEKGLSVMRDKREEYGKVMVVG